jgi:hypothetical protein
MQLGQGLHRPSLPPEQRETRPSIQREDQLTMETKLEQIRIVLSVR